MYHIKHIYHICIICIMLYPIVSPLQLFVSSIPAGQEACQLFIADHAKLIKLEAHGLMVGSSDVNGR